MKVTVGSDNIFKDLGFGAEEAAKLKARSDLMIEIRQLIERKGWTQAEAAERLGVSQPRISDLVRGKIDLFSVDTLIDVLARAGQRVVVKVSENKGSAGAKPSGGLGGRIIEMPRIGRKRRVVASAKQAASKVGGKMGAAARKPAAKK